MRSFVFNPFAQVCHDAGEPIVGNVHLSNRGIAKDAPSFIQQDGSKDIVSQRWSVREPVNLEASTALMG
jgi:hypothetical protein